MVVQFLASFSLLTFATTDLPVFLFDSSSQLKVTVLYVWTAASTLIPLLVLQRPSDTLRTCKARLLTDFVTHNQTGLEFTMTCDFSWLNPQCLWGCVQVKTSPYRTLAFPCFSSHLIKEGLKLTPKAQIRVLSQYNNTDRLIKVLGHCLLI